MEDSKNGANKEKYLYFYKPTKEQRMNANNLLGFQGFGLSQVEMQKRLAKLKKQLSSITGDESNE